MKYLRTSDRQRPCGADHTYIDGVRVEIDSDGRLLKGLSEAQAAELEQFGWIEDPDPRAAETIREKAQELLMFGKGAVEHCYSVVTEALVRDEGLRERMTMFLRHLGARGLPVPVAELVPPAGASPSAIAIPPSPPLAVDPEEEDEGLSLVAPAEEVPPAEPNLMVIEDPDLRLAKAWELYASDHNDLRKECKRRGISLERTDKKEKLVARLLPGLPDNWNEEKKP